MTTETPSILDAPMGDEPPLMAEVRRRFRGVTEAVADATEFAENHISASEKELALLRAGTSQEAEDARAAADVAIAAARAEATRLVEAAEIAADEKIETVREEAREAVRAATEAAELEADVRVHEVEEAARTRVSEVEAAAAVELARVKDEASARVATVTRDAENRVADAVKAVEAANQATIDEVARVEAELNEQHHNTLEGERREHRNALTSAVAEADSRGRRDGRNLALQTMDLLSVTAGDLPVRVVSVLMADALSHDRLTNGFPALELDVPATV